MIPLLLYPTRISKILNPLQYSFTIRSTSNSKRPFSHAPVTDGNSTPHIDVAQQATAPHSRSSPCSPLFCVAIFFNTTASSATSSAIMQLRKLSDPSPQTGHYASHDPSTIDSSDHTLNLK